MKGLLRNKTIAKTTYCCPSPITIIISPVIQVIYDKKISMQNTGMAISRLVTIISQHLIDKCV